VTSFGLKYRPARLWPRVLRFQGPHARSKLKENIAHFVYSWPFWPETAMNSDIVVHELLIVFASWKECHLSFLLNDTMLA